ncbi:MAG: hypothetical protein ABSD32_05915 [Mycobacterium sp.]
MAVVANSVDNSARNDEHLASYKGISGLTFAPQAEAAPLEYHDEVGGLVVHMSGVFLARL